MNNETAIAYAKVAIRNIAMEQDGIVYMMDHIEIEMFQLMDMYTEKEIIKIAKYI